MEMLVDIAAVLQAASIGTTGTNIFYSVLPPTPDACIALFQYQGRPGSRIPQYETPGLQVVVRGAANAYATAAAKMQSIYELLNGKRSFTQNSHNYKYIEAAGSPANNGIDENNRPMLTANFYIIKDI